MSRYVISFAKCGTDEFFILFLLDIYQKLSTMSISKRSRVYVVLENKYLLKLFSLINPIVGQLTKKNQQEKKVLFGASDSRGNILQVEIYSLPRPIRQMMMEDQEATVAA